MSCLFFWDCSSYIKKQEHQYSRSPSSFSILLSFDNLQTNYLFTLFWMSHQFVIFTLRQTQLITRTVAQKVEVEQSLVIDLNFCSASAIRKFRISEFVLAFLIQILKSWGNIFSHSIIYPTWYIFFYRQTVWICSCTPIGVGYGISVLFDGSWSWMRNFFFYYLMRWVRNFFIFLFLIRWVRNLCSAMSTSSKIIKQGIKTIY